jgi:hypothetical protein
MSDRIGEVRAIFADVDLLEPAAAFALGLAYGQAIERERVDADDLAIAGAAARDVLQLVSWSEARGEHPTCVEVTAGQDLARGHRAYLHGPDCPV